MNLFFRSCPAGTEAYSACAIVKDFPGTYAIFLSKCFIHFFCQNRELLISKGFRDERQTFFRKSFFQQHCHVNAMLADFFVEVIGKQGLEL